MKVRMYANQLQKENNTNPTEGEVEAFLPLNGRVIAVVVKANGDVISQDLQALRVVKPAPVATVTKPAVKAAATSNKK